MLAAQAHSAVAYLNRWICKQVKEGAEKKGAGGAVDKAADVLQQGKDASSETLQKGKDAAGKAAKDVKGAAEKGSKKGGKGAAKSEE